MAWLDSRHWERTKSRMGGVRPVERSWNDTAREYLEHLFGPTAEDSCIEIRTRQNDTPGTRQLFIAHLSVLCIDEFPPDGQVWFGVCLCRRGATRRNIEELTWATGLRADLDAVDNKEEKIRGLNRLVYPRTIIVDNGGDLHAYWKLDRAAVPRAKLSRCWPPSIAHN